MWIAYLFIGVLAIAIIIALVIYVNSKEKNDFEDYKNSTWKSSIFVDDEREKERFGELGEEYVANVLKQLTNDNKAYSFNNFIIEYKEGHSIEIDHILICLGGVFIIETKSNKGIIFGDDNDEMWYARKKDWQEDKRFKNPVKQNQGHIYHLKKMFKNNPPRMYSIIIFPAAESINNVNSKYVYDVDSACKFIADKINEAKYSTQFVDRIYKELNDIKNTYGITIEEHKRNISNKY